MWLRSEKYLSPRWHSRWEGVCTFQKYLHGFGKSISIPLGSSDPSTSIPRNIKACRYAAPARCSSRFVFRSSPSKTYWIQTKNALGMRQDRTNRMLEVQWKYISNPNNLQRSCALCSCLVACWTLECLLSLRELLAPTEKNTEGAPDHLLHSGKSKFHVRRW